jgi:cell division septation protein DedD
MAETHDTLDDGFHEIQLSGKQLVFLFMATTIIAVVIFLCGVQVGRNVKGGDRLASAEPSDTVAAQAAAPPPVSAPAQAAPSSGPPAAEPPAPAQDDELSYAKRLQQADPAAGDKVAAPAGDKPAAPAGDRPAAAKPPEARVEAKPAPARPAPGPAPVQATAAPAAAAAGPQGHPGPWIVQLSANKDRTAAVNVARELAGKGYPAFVLDPAPGAPLIYRVQVGGYSDRDKADQAAKKLEKDEHYKPYVRSR